MQKSSMMHYLSLCHPSMLKDSPKPSDNLLLFFDHLLAYPSLSVHLGPGDREPALNELGNKLVASAAARPCSYAVLHLLLLRVCLHDEAVNPMFFYLAFLQNFVTRSLTYQNQGDAGSEAKHRLLPPLGIQDETLTESYSIT